MRIASSYPEIDTRLWPFNRDSDFAFVKPMIHGERQSPPLLFKRAVRLGGKHRDKPIRSKRVFLGQCEKWPKGVPEVGAGNSVGNPRPVVNFDRRILTEVRRYRDNSFCPSDIPSPRFDRFTRRPDQTNRLARCEVVPPVAGLVATSREVLSSVSEREAVFAEVQRSVPLSES
jgi:hypothetical protein